MGHLHLPPHISKWLTLTQMALEQTLCQWQCPSRMLQLNFACRVWVAAVSLWFWQNTWHCLAYKAWTFISHSSGSQTVQGQGSNICSHENFLLGLHTGESRRAMKLGPHWQSSRKTCHTSSKEEPSWSDQLLTAHFWMLSPWQRLNFWKRHREPQQWFSGAFILKSTPIFHQRGPVLKWLHIFTLERRL